MKPKETGGKLKMLCAVGLKADAMMQTRGKNSFFLPKLGAKILNITVFIKTTFRPFPEDLEDGGGALLVRILHNRHAERLAVGRRPQRFAILAPGERRHRLALHLDLEAGQPVDLDRLRAAGSRIHGRRQVLVATEVGLRLTTRLGFAGFRHGDHAEHVPFAQTQPRDAGLQFRNRRRTVVVVGFQRIVPAAELILLLDDVVVDGPTAVVQRFGPAQCDWLLVVVGYAQVGGFAGRRIGVLGADGLFGFRRRGFALFVEGNHLEPVRKKFIFSKKKYFYIFLAKV